MYRLRSAGGRDRVRISPYVVPKSPSAVGTSGHLLPSVNPAPLAMCIRSRGRASGAARVAEASSPSSSPSASATRSPFTK